MPTHRQGMEMVRNFDGFFKETYADTVNGLRRDGIGRDDAHDAAQEAYVRAYARWWRISHYREPAAWVRRVAVNVARDGHRRAVVRENALPRLAASAVVAGPEDHGDFEEVLKDLPRRQRCAVDLYYRAGFSTDEAAEQMGISPGAFRFHLSRARKSLAPGMAERIGLERVAP